MSVRFGTLQANIEHAGDLARRSAGHTGVHTSHAPSCTASPRNRWAHLKPAGERLLCAAAADVAYYTSTLRPQIKPQRLRILHKGSHPVSEPHPSDNVPQASSSARNVLPRSMSSPAKQTHRRRKSRAPRRAPDADELKSSMHPWPPAPPPRANPTPMLCKARKGSRRVSSPRRRPRVPAPCSLQMEAPQVGMTFLMTPSRVWASNPQA